MIECPICHVNNEDQSHFCSECGQRFSPSMQSGGSSPSSPSIAPAGGATWQPGQPPAPLSFGQPAAPADFGSSAPGTSTPSDTGGFGAPPSAFGAPAPSNFGAAAQSPLSGPGSSGTAALVDPDPFPFPPSESTMSQNAPPTSQPQPYSEPPKPARPKLHSPILGGGGDPHDFVGEPQVAPGKRTLRSPLLGGADDGPAEDVSSQNKSKSRKTGGLRSPLLGGGDDADFDAPSKPGAFPHRNRSAEPVNEEPHSAFPHRSKNSIPVQPVSEDAQVKPRKGGLHSPLLGGGQDDFDDPMPRGVNSAEQRPSGNFGRRRLHSPVLDGTGTFDYEAFAEEESGYNEDDPNVLRSPLLAAKSKLPASEKLPPPIPEQPNRTAAVKQTQQGAAQPTSSTPAYKPLTSPADTFAPPPNSAPADAPPAGTAPASVPKSQHAPAAIARPAALNPTGEHVRVPLSIYDSGLRETIPGAIKTGPSWIIVIPSLIGLAAKGFYLMQLVQVPRFADQTGFLVDYAGQILVLVGLLIFGMSASRK